MLAHIIVSRESLQRSVIPCLEDSNCMVSLIRGRQYTIKQLLRKDFILNKALVQYLLIEGQPSTEVEWKVNISTKPVFTNLESLVIIAPSCLINGWQV